MTTYAFIGTGNMSTAIIKGMLSGGMTPDQIIATARSAESVSAASALGIHATQDNQAAVDQADVVVVGVKPQNVREVFGELRFANQMIVSLAAGLPISLFESLCGPRAVVRSMPNTPSLVGAGATGLYANHLTTPEQREFAQRMFSASGLACWVESEALIDAVTAASGSGVAYVFAMIEHMVSGAEKLGLDPETAKALVAQTVLGAAKMTQTSDEDPGVLRERVTSKGGTTAQALAHFETQGFEALVHGAMQAAYDRAVELART